MNASKRKPVSEQFEEDEAWSGGYSIQAFYRNLILLGVFIVFAIAFLCFIPPLRGQSLTWQVLSVVSLLIAGILAGIFVFNRMNRWYTLTNERLIHREGIIVRRHNILELIRVDDVTFEQGPIETLLNCGTIYVSSSDSTHPELEINGIQNVKQIAELIDKLRRDERKKRGIHVEAI